MKKLKKLFFSVAILFATMSIFIPYNDKESNTIDICSKNQIIMVDSRII